MAKDTDGDTALHKALKSMKKVSLGIIEKLIEVGGRKLVMEKDAYGDTALHIACLNRNTSFDIISKLIGVGERELVMLKSNNGDTALYIAFLNKNISFDIISKLIKVGGWELITEKNQYCNSLQKYLTQEGLEWDERLQHVVETTGGSVAHQEQQPSKCILATNFGLKWRRHMKELAEANVDETRT